MSGHIVVLTGKKKQPVVSIAQSSKTVRTYQAEGNTQKIMSKKNIYQSRKKCVLYRNVHISDSVHTTENLAIASLSLKQEMGLSARICYQVT